MLGRRNESDDTVDDEARVDRPTDDDLDPPIDRDFGLEDEEPADRRRDPLRKP